MSTALGTMRSCSRAGTQLEQQNHQPKAVALHGVKQQASRLPFTKLAAAATDIQQVESSSFPGLTAQQVQQFHEDGFLALPGLASQEQVRAVCDQFVNIKSIMKTAWFYVHSLNRLAGS